MANDFVPINETAPQAGILTRFVRALNQTDDLLADIVNRMGHMHDGVDYTTVESNFGLDVGDGVTVVTALASIKTDIDAITGPSIVQVIGRLGPGN